MGRKGDCFEKPEVITSGLFLEAVENRKERLVYAYRRMFQGKSLKDWVGSGRQFCFGMMNNGFSPAQTYEIGMSLLKLHPFIKDEPELAEVFKALVEKCANSPVSELHDCEMEFRCVG